MARELPGGELGSVWDSHVHLYWPEVNSDPSGWAANRGEGHWASMATRRRRSGRAVQGFPTLDELLREMDGAGIERAILQGWYWERAETCAEQNRFYARCVRTHPDRLGAAVTVFAPAGPEHIETEFARAAEAGFCGVGELSPHSQHHPIDHPAFERALHLAGERRWPVTLHVTDPGARPYPGQVATPLSDFDTLARRFPGTSFVLAHWGGLASAPEPTAGRPPPNVFYDTAASPLSHDATVWRRMARSAGADRILFGSDFPLILYPATDDSLGSGLSRFAAEARGSDAGLAPAEQTAVLRSNAERLFPRHPGVSQRF